MAKPKKTLSVRLPEYVTPHLRWRRLIHDTVRAEQRRQGIEYGSSDRLEIRLRLYLKDPALSMHDIDNRLKDVLDALQGRIDGSKKVKPRFSVVPNDSQVWRVVAEKALPPAQSHGLGHLIVRLYRPA